MSDERLERDTSRARWNQPGFSFGRMLLLGLLVLLAFRFLGGGDARPVAYSELVSAVRAGRVERVTFEGDELVAELRPAVTEGTDSTSVREADARRIRTMVPALGDDALLPALRANDVAIQVNRESRWSWGLVLLFLLPLVLLAFLFMNVASSIRGQGKKLMSIGRSRAKRHEPTEETTTYEDVADVSGPKGELSEIATYLQDPGRFQRLGGRPPKGILLVGPPGTGKTLLARATAGEAGVPFFSITGSDFMEMFVGVGASRVRSLFEDARRAAPSIVFIDELDSIGRRRGAGLGGGHDEREQTLNQLLSELDGFTTHEGVIVLAATNRPDILDPALLRPGRFDRRVEVPLPTRQGRREILEIHAKSRRLGPDVDLDRLAEATPGCSGAELANLLNEAALIAAKREHDEILLEDVEEARDKLFLGLERTSLALADDERRLIAVHESGHALTSVVLGVDAVRKVSIIPRGRSMGATHVIPERDRYVNTEDRLRDELQVLMGGRVAEEIALDTRSTGAQDDLQRIAKIARHMVADWGMSAEMPNLAYGGANGEVVLGEQLAQRSHLGDRTASRVDEAIAAIVADVHERTSALVREHRDALERITERLLENEELDGEELRALVEDSASRETRAAR